MKNFSKYKRLTREVRWSLIFISLFNILALGHSLLDAQAKKDSLSRAPKLPSKDLFTKPFCKKVKLRLLTQSGDDELSEYEVDEGVETDLEKHAPGSGPPLDVEVKVLNKSAFEISWLSQTAQVLPIKYFILEYQQAKEEDKPLTQCRQWVEYETKDKNATNAHHKAVVKDLTSDHKYQFRVVTVYNDYQYHPGDKTSWIYLPGDGQAPRATRPPGITSKFFD